MNIELLNKDEKNNVVTFLVKDSSDYFVNTLRRTIIEEVPTLAIEDVEFKDNSSALFDEMVALRLGLMPIKTDLKSYNLPKDCKCKGEGCSQCQLELTLKSQGTGYVLAELVESKDPKCNVVYPKMPIAKLFKGQSLEFSAIAILGQGKEHIKWSPGYVFYRGVPILEVKDKSKATEAIEKLGDKVKETQSGLEVTNLYLWNEADEQICEQNGIQIENSDKDFIMTIESFGQLTSEEIVETAIEKINSKMDEFKKLIE